MPPAEPTRVKICGITRAQDARLAEKLGAWALGFNFYKESPRSVSPADAWKIRRKLELTTQAVGLFVNWRPEVIMYLVHALQLTAVQLHGDETPKQLNYLEDDLPVIKAFRSWPRLFHFQFQRIPPSVLPPSRCRREKRSIRRHWQDLRLVHRAKSRRETQNHPRRWPHSGKRRRSHPHRPPLRRRRRQRRRIPPRHQRPRQAQGILHRSHPRQPHAGLFFVRAQHCPPLRERCALASIKPPLTTCHPEPAEGGRRISTSTVPRLNVAPRTLRELCAPTSVSSV